MCNTLSCQDGHLYQTIYRVMSIDKNVNNWTAIVTAVWSVYKQTRQYNAWGSLLLKENDNADNDLKNKSELSVDTNNTLCFPDNSTVFYMLFKGMASFIPAKSDIQV